MCFSIVKSTAAPGGCLFTKVKTQRPNESRKGVQFAMKAECHLVTSIDDMTPSEYSKERTLRSGTSQVTIRVLQREREAETHGHCP